MAGTMDGRVALVTGGGLGIGRATSLAFSRAGAKVVVGDVAVESGEETARMITETGGEAVFVNADVSNTAEVEALIAKTIETYGALHYAFNNAGIGGDLAPTAMFSESDWASIIAIDLKGVWLCMKYEIPEMLKQGGGAIVNTSSAAGLIGTPNLCAYTAAKHGVVGLTKTAALEYAKAGIRVNAVCPGPIQTPGAERMMAADPKIGEMIIVGCPMGRMGTPEEVAEPVVWLCSNAASYITGHIMTVDGGIVAQ